MQACGVLVIIYTPHSPVRSSYDPDTDMKRDIKEISESLRAWKAENPKHRAVIMIAVDATQQPFCEASIGVDEKQRLLIDALKVAIHHNNHHLAVLTLAAIEELSDGLNLIEINFN